MIPFRLAPLKKTWSLFKNQTKQHQGRHGVQTTSRHHRLALLAQGTRPMDLSQAKPFRLKLSYLFTLLLCDKVPGKNTLKKEGFLLSHDLRVKSITGMTACQPQLWWQDKEALVTLHVQSGSEHRALVLSWLSDFPIFTQPRAPEHGVAVSTSLLS